MDHATILLKNSADDDGEAAKARSDHEVKVQQSGVRHVGSDESGGWIWPCSTALEASLLEQPDICWEGQRVLELGSGTGWLALRLAQLGALVTATDRGGAMKLLMQNIERNQRRFGLCGPDGDEEVLQVACSQLDWEDPSAGLEQLSGPWDWIVASDVLYLP